MNYTLKHKDLNLAMFSTTNNTVDGCIIAKEFVNCLPLPLKRLIKPGYSEEFVEEETEEYYMLNEEGCFLFDAWLSDREIPVNRYNYHAYIQKDSSPRVWLLENNGYSFNDCYWFEAENEELSWGDIIKRLDNLDKFYSIKDDKKRYSGHNSTLGGQLEKFWYKKDDKVHLCKKIDMQYDILIAREILASYLYERQGYENYCSYSFVYNRLGKIVGCTCECFTNPQTELVTAYDLLEEYNMTRTDDVWQKIVEFASNYGLNEQATRDYLDIQTLVDFLITNRDRHQNNIGFLRDADTLQIFSPAPIFDNGSSKYKEGEYPESTCNTTVNGLYETEIECLQHVNNFSIIDISKLLTRKKVQSILDKCNGLSEHRKEQILNLYEEKKEFLKELQKQYSSGVDMEVFLEEYKSSYDKEDFET